MIFAPTNPGCIKTSKSVQRNSHSWICKIVLTKTKPFWSKSWLCRRQSKGTSTNLKLAYEDIDRCIRSHEKAWANLQIQKSSQVQVDPCHPVNAADILQWNISGLHIYFLQIDIILMSYEWPAVCLQDTQFCQAHAASSRSYDVYRYNHLAGDMVNGSVAISSHYCIHSFVVLLQSIIPDVAAQLLLASLKFRICSVYLSSHNIVSLADLQDLNSQLPAPHLWLGSFNTQHHLWGSVDEDDRGWATETVISGFNHVILNMCGPTHISLASCSISLLDLVICNPAISAVYSICWNLSVQLSVLH